MNPDDSIPNVAVSLAQHGRYGFLSSPTQGLHDVDRTYAFFNYGPLYFYVAAALTWLIGPSLILYRMLHPAGIVFIVLASIWAFRRISLLGTALLAVSIFDIYLTSQWPLARPDIMVSICGAFMLIFAARAIDGGGWLNWFAMGFFAASAVTTHQIAAAMIPVAGIVWGWSVLAERSRPADREIRTTAAASFAALFLGGAAAVLVYLLAIDFRLKDLWILGTAGMKVQPTPYLVSLHRFFDYAWASWPQIWRRSTEAAFLGAFLLVMGGWFLTGLVRRRILAFVMPPVVAALLYQLSLGFYGNQHTGYVILSQVTTCWAVAGMVAVIIATVRDRSGPRGRAFELTVIAGVICMLIVAGAAWARTPSTWQARAAGNVSISDYVRQVVAPLPERASVWGSLYFGLDAGDRTDLVQFTQMWNVLNEDFHPEQRTGLAPDFLALSSYELDTDSVLAIAGHDTTLEYFGNLFPHLRYRLVNMVYAPPFGVTREYERLLEPQQDVTTLPGIAVNDGVGRQWSRNLSAPLDVKFSAAEPVVANVSIYSWTSERAALSSVAADMPPGFYLIDVDLQRTDSKLAGFILATPGRYFYWLGNWTSFSMPAAPYVAGAKNAWVLVDHLGGPLFLSQFENPPAGTRSSGIRVSSVRRVAILADRTGRMKPFPLPAWATWESKTKSVSSLADTQGNLHLTGSADSDEWLMQSPPVAVPAGQRLVLSLPTEPSGGGVEVGVMDPKGSWIAPPTLMPRRVVFDTGTSTSVTIMLANSHLGRSKPLEVSIKPGSLLPVAPQMEYVDRLMGCRSPYIHLRDLDCAKK